MIRRARLFFLAAFVSVALAAGVLWAGSEGGVPTRSFQFQYTARIPAVPQSGKKLRVWIPVPQSDKYQEISRLTIESPVPYEFHQDPTYRNRYVYLEVGPGAGASRGAHEVRMRFHVKRREHKVNLGASQRKSNAPRPSPEELARALQPDRLVPLDGMIGALAEQETRGLIQPLEKARAIYNYVVSTVKYDKSVEGWGRGDAIFACTVKKGNCTDFHALFIGMMRAAGIPARFEIGFPLPDDKNEGEIGGYHCWAQFYLEGAGWVPVDASEAWKNPTQRDYFFGAHDTERVLFTRGRDVRFNPAQQGEPLNYFIYPYAELDGKPIAAIESKFSFRDLPAKTR